MKISADGTGAISPHSRYYRRTRPVDKLLADVVLLALFEKWRRAGLYRRGRMQNTMASLVGRFRPGCADG